MPHGTHLTERIRKFLLLPENAKGAIATHISQSLGTDQRNTYTALKRMRDAYIMRRARILVNGRPTGRKAAFWAVVKAPADVPSHRVLTGPVDPPCAPPALGEYWTGQGGIYLGIYNTFTDAGLVHLVVGDCTQSGLTWGESPTPSECAASRTDGRLNTQELLAAGTQFPAAAWAAAYSAESHKDFHLPSTAELNQLLIVSRLRQLALRLDKVWSSTHHSVYGAFIQGFRVGESVWVPMQHAYQAVAMRWVSL